MNSFIVSSFTTLLTLLFGIPAAYGLARGNFKHKETLSFALITPLLLSGVIVLIPLYALMAMIGLINTLYSVIFLISVWQLPIAVWILEGFFERIPIEVEESALIDGCSKIGVLLRITMPLAVNGVCSAAIYTFVVSWNEFWIPFIFTSSLSTQTAPLSVWGFFASGFEIFWGKFAAFTVLAIAPPLILFLLFQKLFVEGMIRGAVKG
jgi:ABC-type glycerol-3-phosphate transport system permease component